MRGGVVGLQGGASGGVLVAVFFQVGCLLHTSDAADEEAGVDAVRRSLILSSIIYHS